MSQSRKFKVPPSAEYALSNGDNGPRHKLSMARTVKDLQSRSTHPNECRRKKSNNRIPKSLRYDLESALVGLCDVWFENIKPHLVRNNIKLHVHNTEAAADAACACGDFETPAMPPCTHLDPASSAEECMLCRLLCKAANSIGSAMFQATSVDLPKPNVARMPPVPICPPITPLSALRRSKQIVTVASQTVPQMYCTWLDNLCSLRRPRGTTPLSYYKTQQPWRNRPILFQNDLIDIIGKRNDEILRDISKSQEKVGYPSLVNLISPRDKHKTSALKKNPPWR